MGYFEDLTKAFDIAAMKLGKDNGITVALENINAPTSVNNPYLASYMLLAPTEQGDLSWTERRAGIYQIDINYAQNTGSAECNRMADLINKTFAAGVSFKRGEICAEVQSVSLGPLIVSGGWAKRPLSINFVAYTKRL